jgi:hypothetical protein
MNFLEYDQADGWLLDYFEATGFRAKSANASRSVLADEEFPS